MERQNWERLLKRFGQSITLVAGAERQVCRAFFQPIRAAREGVSRTELGLVPEGDYLYLGPVEPDPESMDGLEYRGRRFRFLRCRLMELGDEPLYRWAVAREEDRGVRP